MERTQNVQSDTGPESGSLSRAREKSSAPGIHLSRIGRIMRGLGRYLPKNHNLGFLHYFFFTYLLLLVNTSGYLHHLGVSDLPLTAYSIVLYLTYTFIYIAPAALFVFIGAIALLGWPRIDIRQARFRKTAIYALAIAGAALTQIVIDIDKVMFDIFGFHFNGFVLNLITTPGGLESMGSGDGSVLSFTLICLGFVLAQTAAAVILFRPKVVHALDRYLKPRFYVSFFALFAAGTLGERAAFVVAKGLDYTQIGVAAAGFPFYLRPSFSAFEKVIGGEHGDGYATDRETSRLNYPLRPIQIDPPKQKFNIVWLVAESLRADMLDPEIMPATWAFAQKAHRFTQHYSGGKGTRMGMFSMFYGLYGSYWFAFLAERRGPVFFDVLKREGYDFYMRTSAKFTYPEFDRTIFASLPKSVLHSKRGKSGWESDRKNIARIVRFIQEHDRTHPFMVFMFYESPHARYYFPPESVIRRPYLDRVDYAHMDLKRDIGLIKNRYINAVHHLDSQIERVLKTLREENLLDRTIVIITGDHGEEFMEKGRWGHNSAFTEEQTRSPFVLWVPGTGSSVRDDLTSHLDMAPTILPLLGVKNPPEDYCLGFNLFDSGRRRSQTIIADWSKLCCMDGQYKLTYTHRAKAFFERPIPITTRDDAPVEAGKALKERRQKILLQLMKNMGRFLAKSDAKQGEKTTPDRGS